MAPVLNAFIHAYAMQIGDQALAVFTEEPLPIDPEAFAWAQAHPQVFEPFGRLLTDKVPRHELIRLFELACLIEEAAPATPLKSWRLEPPRRTLTGRGTDGRNGKVPHPKSRAKSATRTERSAC